MKRGFVKKITCVLSCAALLACTVPPTASAAVIQDGKGILSAYPGEEGPNITHSGPLTIEAHLQARMGYPVANYTIYIYAPSDVVGMQINDMNILTGNSVVLQGSVNESTPHTGSFNPITVKVTLYYADKAPYVSYETISTTHWCGVMHPTSDHCTP